MTHDEFLRYANECTHTLGDHHRQTGRERLQAVVESPFCDERPDHYGRGGFVSKLETEIAELLGKEAAVFMPSGTMAQPIALRIWADRANNKRVGFHPTCHLYLHEHMGYQELHHLEEELVGASDRLFTLDDLMAVERPLSSLLIELPQREIGGQLPTWEELSSIIAFAKENGVRLHLDGARLWECQPFYSRPYADIVAGFDSVYVSFYKVLGGLPGAILAGPGDFIDEARIWMRRQGGNLFQMYPLAVSAKVALDRHLSKIPKYVSRAAEIASILSQLPGISIEPEHPPTNMMHLYFDAPVEKVIAASGEIAKAEKFLLVSWAAKTERGPKFELWIGDNALDIPIDRITGLLTKFSKLLAAN